MYKYLNKKFILDINSGICHDFSNMTKSCNIHQIEFQNVFDSDLLDEEIKRHPRYKKKCVYCMFEYYY